MPYGSSALSSHILFSEYRGPRILNDASAPPPATPPAPPKEGEEPNPPAAPPANPPKPDDHEGRISQLAKENKELKEWKKEQERLKKEAEDKQLQEAGEHQKLAEQYKNESATEKAAREAAEAKIAKYEAQMTKQIEEQIKAISDADKQKKVTELLGDRPVEEKMEMLPNILSLVGVAPQSFGGPTPTTTKDPDKTEVDTKRSRFEELRQKTIAGTITPAERAESHRLQTELSEVFQKEQEAKKTT